MSNTLFPIFLRLDRLNTLVVGGGNVALEKVSALLRNAPEARITMVAPFFRLELLDYFLFIYKILYHLIIVAHPLLQPLLQQPPLLFMRS